MWTRWWHDIQVRILNLGMVTLVDIIAEVCIDTWQQAHACFCSLLARVAWSDEALRNLRNSYQTSESHSLTPQRGVGACIRTLAYLQARSCVLQVDSSRDRMNSLQLSHFFTHYLLIGGGDCMMLTGCPSRGGLGLVCCSITMCC
jgi:hypothetical protein